MLFQYDGLNRLINTSYAANHSDNDFLKEKVSYLADGRIKNMKRGSIDPISGQTYQYTAGTNQLKCVDTDIDTKNEFKKNRTCTGSNGQIPRYTYDLDGNLAKNSEELVYPLSENLSNATEIKYDWRNLPWKFSKEGRQYIMVYDAAGQRVSKIDYSVAGDGTTSWQVRKHYLPGSKEIREFSNGNADVEYGELKGNTLLGRIDQTGKKDFYLNNHLGNLVTTVSDGGVWASASLYDYFPYGKQEVISRDGNPNVTQAFTGKELDDELGYYYFGARYYDADLGLWISPDPARQFVSPYAYGPNPINSVDPDGRKNTVYYRNSSSVSLPGDYSYRLSSELQKSNLDFEVQPLGFWDALTFKLWSDKSDVFVSDINQRQSSSIANAIRPMELGNAVLNSRESEVFVDKTQPIGFMQTLKTTIHEIGHALFGFGDNTGGVMNQGNVANTGTTFTQDQQVQIKSKLNEDN